ncbi:MAG: hypothetical protein OSB21_13145 [Myxococcota bacterium]|nr:hypothetical protein [Myxococcota bacterium]
MNRLVTLVLAASCAACPDADIPSPDAGPNPTDSGSHISADVGIAPVDAGVQTGDASVPVVDAGPPAVDVSDLLECSSAMQCRLVPNQCCAPCGSPEAEQLVAVNGERASQARERYCEGQNSNDCPRCPEGPPRQTLRATCLENSCTMVDLELASFTTCSADSDCTLTLSMCCDSCVPHGADDLIAVRQDQLQNVRDAYCGDEPPMCPACSGAIIPGLSAKCVAGSCFVQER